MNRLNYGRISGVIVDYCKDHGYWLDAGELEKIAKWVATGGLNKQYARELEDMKAEKSRLSRATDQMRSQTHNQNMGNSFQRGRDNSLAGDFLNVVSRLFDF